MSRLPPVEQVGFIPDLRSHSEFWEWCKNLLICSTFLIQLPKKPNKIDIELIRHHLDKKISGVEIVRQWRKIHKFRNEMYKPQDGDEIACYEDYRPHNGTHRACALAGLGLSVPCLIVKKIY